MVQRASPEPSADPPDPSTGRVQMAQADLAQELVQRSPELHELQHRLQAELDERGRIERALRDSETRARHAQARLRQAIESVSDGFALGTQMIIWCSPTSAIVICIPHWPTTSGPA
jgi:PAS domain-containing protein